MVDLGVGGYRTQDIIDQLHFKYGRRESFITIDLLNKYDVQIGTVESIKGQGFVQFNSEAQIQRVGNVTVKENEFNDIDWINDRIRPVFNLRMPDGGLAKWSLGVFLISSPTRKMQNGEIIRELELFDKNLILREDKIVKRLFYPRDKKYVDLIKDILNGASIPQVQIEDSPLILPIEREFEPGTPKIEIVNDLLNEINYKNIWVDNNGYFQVQKYIEPVKREVEYTYRTDDYSIIQADAIEETDLFNAPNVWYITYSNPEQRSYSATYENNSLSSITSIPNRGRRIVKLDTIDNIPNQQTLKSVTKRMAYRDSQVYSNLTFTTAVMPHHTNDNMLFINMKGLDVDYKYLEKRWRINFNGTMEHECKRIVYV